MEERPMRLFLIVTKTSRKLYFRHGHEGTPQTFFIPVDYLIVENLK